MLDLNLSPAEDLVGLGTLLLGLLLKPGKVPDSDRLVEGGRRNEGVIGMEGGAHDVVAVASEDGEDVSTLPVPKADSLIITAAQDPRQFLVKLNSSDIIEMSSKRKHALLLLVVPYLYFVVITS